MSDFPLRQQTRRGGAGCLTANTQDRFPGRAAQAEPLGTSLGLRTNANAQVCAADGAIIPGLYAVGNDMHSVMGGEYPGAGAQLGPGMTFGYLAARHAARTAM